MLPTDSICFHTKKHKDVILGFPECFLNTEIVIIILVFPSFSDKFEINEWVILHKEYNRIWII